MGITGILTTCNRPPEVLARAYRSMLDQTLPPDEIVIVNAGRNGLDIGISENTVIIDSPGSNSAEARNIGIEHSSNDLLAFLDDDDVWYRNRLEDQCAAMVDGIGIVSSPYDMDGAEFPIKRGNILQENWIGSTSFPLVRKDAVLSAGGFDTSFPANQEWDLWTRICRDHGVAVTDRKVGLKETGENSLTADIDKRISGWKAMFSKHAEDYRKDRKACREALGTFRYEMFVRRSIKGLVVSETMLLGFRLHLSP